MRSAPVIIRGRMGRPIRPIQRGAVPLTIKRLGKAGRTFSGIASTGAVDRMGDILEPRGATISLPAPLLWQHRHDVPVGRVTRATVSDTGIEIEATIAEIDTRGPLRQAADDAWAAVRAGLVDSLSVGFLPRASEPIKGGGRRFTSWDLLEVSIVTVPANAGARISAPAKAAPTRAERQRRLAAIDAALGLATKRTLYKAGARYVLPRGSWPIVEAVRSTQVPPTTEHADWQIVGRQRRRD
jgi:HK97 family phage prohead protease